MAISRRCWAALVGLALPHPAWAQVDAQRSVRDGGDWLLLHDAAIGRPWTGAATVSVGHARGLVRSVPAVAGPRLLEVTTRELGASIALGRAVELGIALPHHGSLVVGTTRPDGHLGDVGLWATVPLVARPLLSVAVAAAGDLGNGLNSLWLGDPAALDTVVAAQLRPPGPLSVAASGGPRWQPRVEIPRGHWGSAWQGGGGVHLTTGGPLVLGAEVAGRRPIRRADADARTVSAEALGTVGLRLSGWATLTGAAGAGLGDGIGAPAWRALGCLDVRSRERWEAEPPVVEVPDASPVAVVLAPQPEPVVEAAPPPPLPAPAPPADPEWVVSFASGSASVGHDDPGLEAVRGWMEVHPHVALLEVQGRADWRGSASANQILSERRAEAVVAWLVAHGVSPRRLVAVGLGEVDEGAGLSDAEARRVRFVVRDTEPAGPKGG